MSPFYRAFAFVFVFVAFAARTWAAPTVTVTSPTPGATVSTFTAVSITFSEAVTSVDADDLLINADAALLVTGSGAGPYVFTFTQPPPGTVNVGWAGDHGIVGQGGTGSFFAGASWTYTLTDTIAPTVTKLTPAAGSTVGALTQAEVVFSETVTGVDAADLTINGVVATGLTGSGFGPYVFTFAQPATGTVTFAWIAGHGIKDTAAAPNNFAGGSWTVTRSAAGFGNVVINEFLASNGVGLADENADNEDWIEIYNAGATTVNLSGWALTNDADRFGQWVFPNWTLDAGRYLVVFASAKDRKPAQVYAGETNGGVQATSSPRLHANFRLNENGGYLALVGPESPRVAVSQFPANYNPLAIPPVTEFPEQRTDYSYGPQTGGALRYFATPTPGAVNGTSTLTAITPKPNFSVTRGFFKDSFQLVLSCSDASATIRYTTDFTEPTAGTGTLYSAPITISATTCLRAVAFSNTKIPSLPVTHSYIFLEQVLSQTNTPAGFPTNWGTAYGTSVFSPASSTAGLVPADYEMDTDPLRVDPNNAASAVDATKLQMFKDGLRELPLLSITAPMADMFNSTGTYAYPNVTNKSFGYRKCAVEMILPDGSTAFSEICGIGGHGNASRDPLKNPKHGFQLKFKGDYGNGSLSYQLFADSPVNQFDDIILRPDFNSSWRHWSDDAGNANGAFQRSRGVRIRDAMVKDTFHTMGGVASHHRFFHLFINGLYWGLYDFAEQPVDSFGKNYFGGSKNDYDVVHEGNLRAGDLTVYNAMIGQPATTTNALYDTMKGYLDMTEFIDYTLLHFYVGHQDWGSVKNWYAIRRRASTNNPTQGKFQYIPWDDECTMLDTTVNRTSNTDVPSGLHTKLVNHAQYKLDFADRAQRSLVAPGGALVSANMVTRWNKWQAVVDKPMEGEACRWGDYRRDVHNYSTGSYVLYTRENQFLAECTRMTGTYFPGRVATLISQLQTAGLYPAVLAPEYRQNTTGGTIIGTSQVNAGAVVALNAPGGAGVIYYTTDGNDPHIYYTPTTGATASSVAATAAAYSTPLTINATTTLKSRILSGGVWSALNEATFSVGTTLPAVRITEIMYNPPGGNAHEFIELQNVGATAVDMSGFYMEGVDFLFPLGTILNPTDRLVLANNDGASGGFAAQYPGVAVFGYFGGSLDNGGERLALHDALTRTVVSVDFDDLPPWPTLPDGGGYSLEIINALGDPDDPFNWKASAALRGTPGAANSAPASAAVELSEVLAKNVSAVNNAGTFPDYVELRNTTGATVDITGWTLTTTNNFVFPAGTTLPAGGYLIVYCDNAGTPDLHTGGSGLGDASGMVLLKNGATLIDGVSYGNQAANFSIGKVSGAWTLVTPSPGAMNMAATTAALTSLALNEWLANATPGDADWLELYNKDAALPLALKGVPVQTSTNLAPISALAFIEPHGWLQLFCDEQPGANQLDLKLHASGTTLSLLNPSGVTLDSVTFGAQTQGVSQGRLPDGTGATTTFTGSNSPGATNYVINYTGPVLNEVVARNVTGAQAPWGTRADWVEFFNPNASSFDLSGMKLGATNNAAAAWTIPAGTSVAANGYLAIWCDAAQPASGSASADLNTGFALGDASGGLYLFNTSGQLMNQIEWGFQIVDRAIGRDAGVWKLLASPTRAAANSAAVTLGAVTQLRINEWASAIPAQPDWFELYNLDTNPVAMAGLYLTDDPSELGRIKFQVAALSFIDGHGWVKWEADNAPELGRNHVSFTLDGDAEYLRLSNNDANLTVIDAVSFGIQSTTTTQGRILDGQTIQSGLTPTPGARNILPPAPSFSTQPNSQAVAQGANVTFTVAASGSAPLTVQWQRNGADIGGATATSLVLNGVTPANEGAYTCIAANTAGNATSNAATLIVTQTFAQWSASNGIANDPTGDPDADGISNLLEFFAHTNPNAEMTAADRAALPQLDREPATGQPAYLTLTYRRNAHITLTSVAYQAAAALGTWSTVAPDVTENLSPDPVTGDPRTRVKFAVAPADTTKFLRLLLTP